MKFDAELYKKLRKKFKNFIIDRRKKSFEEWRVANKGASYYIPDYEKEYNEETQETVVRQSLANP